uniref:BATXWAP1 n=2 Tax=Bothrops TaxID=8721 RepID=A0A1L8D652_BOTAT
MKTILCFLLGAILLGMLGPMASAEEKKPGSCPNVDMPIPPLGVCRNTCKTDSNCADKMKCCKNGCGYMSCSNPMP